jgi:hypothetical protein
MCGFAALQGALCLLDVRLEESFLDAIQRVALVDRCAFLEEHLLQEPFHPRPYFDAVDRFYASDKLQAFGYRFAFGFDRPDRDRGGPAPLGMGRKARCEDQKNRTDCWAHSYLRGFSGPNHSPLCMGAPVSILFLGLATNCYLAMLPQGDSGAVLYFRTAYCT